MLMRMCGRSTTAVATAIVAAVKKKDDAVAAVAIDEDETYPPPIVLEMDLHCMSCAKKVKDVTTHNGHPRWVIEHGARTSIAFSARVEKVTVELEAGIVAVTGTVDEAVLATSVAVRTRRTVTVVRDLGRQVAAGGERINVTRAPDVEAQAQHRAAEQETLNRAAAVEEQEREKKKNGAEGHTDHQEKQEVVAQPPLQVGTGNQTEEWTAELRIAGLHRRRCMTRIVERGLRNKMLLPLDITLSLMLDGRPMLPKL